LEAYFDDSGTDARSEVVVWAGVIGPVSHFDKLDAAWGEMLREPLPGKPSLKKFGAADCRHASNEFEYYRPAERDALRYRVREIIQSSGLDAIAYAIQKKLYDSVIRGRVRRDYGEPSGIAFASCADMALQVSQKLGNVPLNCIFDAGQQKMDPALDLYVRDAEKRARLNGIPVSYGFAPVAGSFGLQAADTIATEHFWYAVESLDQPYPAPKPHFLSLLNMVEPVGWTMTEHELQAIRRSYYKARPLRDWIKGAKGRR
jgi:hypothetical protein